jgi:ribonuclease BN (tRNA processing enzyme)
MAYGICSRNKKAADTMNLICGGVRGTSPVADPAFMKFGGETTSFLVESASGDRVMVDVGTGTRVLSPALQKTGMHAVRILLTHYHQDHLMGFASFPMIYNPDWNIRIAGPEMETVKVADIFHGMMSRPFWPLQIDALQASIEFENLPLQAGLSPQTWGELSIRWCPVHHQGGCLAYRFDEPATGHALVIATDIEWGASTNKEKADFLALCRNPMPANLLVFDGHCTPQNYSKYRNWGHSTWQDAQNILMDSGIPRLLVTHHAPYADDTALEKIEKEMQTEIPRAVFARQGMQLDLP